MADTQYLTTVDTALASWLYSQGCELVKVENERFPAVFHFDNSLSAQEYVHDFQRGEATGNILSFFRAYKKLVKMAKARD